ncbi:MAG: hypothetical protein ABUS79_00900 [Pseudomonadota bacterium]
MPRAHVVVAPVLVIAAALGIWSVTAIRRTAERRETLVDTLGVRVPPVPGARLLAPWQPVADADLAHLTLCFDDTDPAGAALLFAAALAGTPWRSSEVQRESASGRASVLAQDGTYRLRALAEPGSRGNCDNRRGQTLVSIEAAPLARRLSGEP